MTLFADNFQACAALPTYFGETITWYRGGVGDGVEVSAIVTRERRAREDNENAESFMSATTVRLKPTVVSGLLGDSNAGLNDEVGVAAHLGASGLRRYAVIDRQDRADGDLVFTLRSVEESQSISHALAE